MSMLGTVIRFEFVRSVNKRNFWVRTLAIPVLLAGVFSLAYFSDKTSKTASEMAQQESFSITILDQSKLITPAVIKAAHLSVSTDKDAGIQAVKGGKTDAFFYYPANPATNPVQVYAKDDGIAKDSKYTDVATGLLQASLAQSIGSPQKVALLQAAPSTQLTTYQDGQQTKGIGRVVAPGIFLVLFYAVIVLLGNQMLTSTTEEKENRVIEMILTSVKARTLIIGKILALMMLGLVQILAILVPIIVAYLKFRTQLHIPQLDLNQISFDPGPILLGAGLFVGGFLLFTGMLVAIGSAVPTAKDASAFFGITILLMVMPVYAVNAIISNPDQLIVKVFSFFPLTAPITLMVRNAVGNLSPTESVVGLAILFVAGLLMLGLAVRVFRYGTLEYSRKLGIGEILTRKA